MNYHLIDADPAAASVRRLSFVLFLPDGACAVTPDGPGGLSLPTARVRDGEHYLLDTCLRAPLDSAGYRPQRVHPFAVVLRLTAWPIRSPSVPMPRPSAPSMS